MVSGNKKIRCFAVSTVSLKRRLKLIGLLCCCLVRVHEISTISEQCMWSELSRGYFKAHYNKLELFFGLKPQSILTCIVMTG